jgi:uncharacterized protein
MTPIVTHDTACSRFVTVVDGHECVLEYALAGSVMTITHTNVPQAIGGRGIAGDLMRAALDAARASHWKVVPDCAYAAVFFKRHPDDADLLA